jgi:transcriptional regulator with XRE-family HTH domain
MADHPLRRWRTERSVTLTTLADQVGVYASHLSEIENRNNRPSLRLAAKLSQITGLPLESFVQSEAAQ